MQTDIRYKNLELEAPLRELVRARLLRRLRRFAGEVTSAHVHLEDLNGPRGGIDKRCLVTVVGRRLGRVVVAADAASAGAAVHEALRRTFRAVARALGRTRDA